MLYASHALAWLAATQALAQFICAAKRRSERFKVKALGRLRKLFSALRGYNALPSEQENPSPILSITPKQAGLKDPLRYF